MANTTFFRPISIFFVNKIGLLPHKHCPQKPHSVSHTKEALAPTNNEQKPQTTAKIQLNPTEEERQMWIKVKKC